MSRTAPEIRLAPQAREQLAALAQVGNDARYKLRASIIVAAAQGQTNQQIGSSLKLTVATVGKWRGRFLRSGVSGLNDRPRSGRRLKLNQEEHLNLVKEGRWPRETERRLTCQSAGPIFGITKSTVHRIWTQQGIRRRKRSTPGSVISHSLKDWADLYSLLITADTWIVSTLCGNYHWQWEDDRMEDQWTPRSKAAVWRLVAGISCLSRRIARVKESIEVNEIIRCLDEIKPAGAWEPMAWHVLVLGTRPKLDQCLWKRIGLHPEVHCYTPPRYSDPEEALLRFLMDQRSVFSESRCWRSLVKAENQLFDRLDRGGPWHGFFTWTAAGAAEGTEL